MDDEALTKRVLAILGGIPGWEYDPDPDAPAYPASSVGLYYGAIQPDPDRAVGARIYASVDDDVHSRRLQLRLRGRPHDPAGADALAGVAFTVLHELSRVGGISDIRRISTGPLGADSLGREERSDNYQLILDNPEAIPQ